MNALRIAVAAVLFAFPAFAQLKLPAKSPGAKLSQTVGLTDITIDYSSPGVKGRKIWGGLVPYNEVWRAGANSSTRITFSKDVEIQGTPVPAGTYALFVLPTAKDWTLIVSKDASGSSTYKKDSDLLRVNVKPTAIPQRERLAYLVSNFTEETASIDLEWEKMRVSLPVSLKTKEQALANIKDATESAWQPMTNAARWLMDEKMYPEAMAKVDASIAVRETWLNTWVKAQILAGQGKFKEAYPLAEKAKTMGEKDAANFFFAEDVKKALGEWKNKG